MHQLAGRSHVTFVMPIERMHALSKVTFFFTFGYYWLKKLITVDFGDKVSKIVNGFNYNSITFIQEVNTRRVTDRCRLTELTDAVYYIYYRDNTHVNIMD